MSKKKVLFVTQELNPYTEISFLSDLARKIPHYAANEGYELRVLMPKFGIINERRHRLHEVVRLSGMNIIVDDEDYPLIIKVASLPGARLQVYFLDNEEFFKRKSVFHDEDNVPFTDNQERLVFFCKGVMETVKKFGWSPDIVHLHGQITSLIPLYMKKAYKNDPVFADAKIIYSVYNNELSDSFDSKFLNIAAINDLEPEDLDVFKEDGKINLDLGAIKYSDGIISGSESSNDIVKKYGEENNKPFQTSPEGIDLLAQASVEFYKTLFEE
ncbi:MAG: glycogen/starch synthase [Saprospiraceae bacterium]|nr:glycogen/starch synthase [Saprospiraceae bacterium]MBL0098788.1 glycogen/starch synthase [Saprospiraceae bacterium]